MGTKQILKGWYYHYPKFLDRPALANSEDPVRRSSLILVFTVRNLLQIFLKHYFFYINVKIYLL